MGCQLKADSFAVFNRLQASNPHTKSTPKSQLDRYQDTVPWVETLVKVPDVPYINASHLSFGRCKFIAAQSPVVGSIGHFWQMVLHHRIPLIVMVVRVEPPFRCIKYWKDGLEFGSEGQGEKFRLKIDTKSVHGPFVQRRIHLLKKQGSGDVLVHALDHWQYTAWPDEGVPKGVEEILAFVKMFLQAPLHPTTPPLIHCSAGVGRTGTLATIWTAFLENKRQPSELAEIIGHFKHQRNQHFCVQTDVQFDFVLRATAQDLNSLPDLSQMHPNIQPPTGIVSDLGPLNATLNLQESKMHTLPKSETSMNHGWSSCLMIILPLAAILGLIIGLFWYKNKRTPSKKPSYECSAA